MDSNKSSSPSAAAAAAAILDVTSKLSSLTTEEEGPRAAEAEAAAEVASSSPITEPTDWVDFSRKMTAVVRFCAFLSANGGGVDGKNRYGEKVHLAVQGSSKTAKKPIVLVWSCPGLAPRDPDLPPACQPDNRNHEAILRHHFAQYALLIFRKGHVWKCTIYSGLDDDQLKLNQHRCQFRQNCMMLQPSAPL